MCVDHLLALENSIETRAACVRYLQHHMVYFYPECHDIIRENRNIARNLGGNLLPPKRSWKMWIMTMIFGWRTAKYLKNIAWRMEIKIRKIIHAAMRMLFK